MIILKNMLFCVQLAVQVVRTHTSMTCTMSDENRDIGVFWDTLVSTVVCEIYVNKFIQKFIQKALIIHVYPTEIRQ